MKKLLALLVFLLSLSARADVYIQNFRVNIPQSAIPEEVQDKEKEVKTPDTKPQMSANTQDQNLQHQNNHQKLEE